MTWDGIAEVMLNWVVAPLGAAVVWLLMRLRALHTQDTELRQEMHDELARLSSDIRVLEAKLEAQADMTTKAQNELSKQINAMMSKLDSIEGYLRKG